MQIGDSGIVIGTDGIFVTSGSETHAETCCCTGGSGQGPGCECVVPVDTVTVTVALTGNTYYNGTYPNIPVAGGPPNCGWIYNWEDIDPPPSQETAIDVGLDGSGHGTILVTVGSSVGLSHHLEFVSGLDTPIVLADDFCDGVPIVFTVNETDFVTPSGGSVTVTAD